MKVLTINSVPYGSIARISVEIAELCDKESIENRVAFGFSKHPIYSRYIRYRIANAIEAVIHLGLTRLTGLNGVYSYLNTLRFLKSVSSYSPDIIHIHNLHGNSINIPLLMKYIKKHNIPVVMTLHDCWNFTGHCAHFDAVGCNKWQSQCKGCPPRMSFPKVYIDNSNMMFILKKKWFSELSGLTIVTPSKWLASKVQLSFLRNYPINVINNGIDLSVFKRVESRFRQSFKIESSFVVLGVAIGWDYKKGLDSFVKLASIMPPEYTIVLVGTIADSSIKIPSNIITIGRIQNQRELVDIYSGSDVFVNLTMEDTFPTVNIEALACGLPVVTYNTGGSPEIIDKETGYVVDKGDIQNLLDKLMYIKQNKPFSSDACRRRAEQFDKNERFMDYVNLYRKIIKSKTN